MLRAGGSFGDVLRERRRRDGLTQQELSRRAGVSVRAVRDIEAGRVRPRPESVRRLAAVVGVDLDGAATAEDGGVPHGPGVQVPGATSTGAERLRVGVLGPLTVRHGARLATGSPMQRRLLGLLAVQPNQVVGYEEIIDTLWGEQPPSSGRDLVRAYISRLRGLLGPPSAPGRAHPGSWLVAAGGGYVLRVGEGELDVLRFDALVARARPVRADQPWVALELLAQALECWRGPMLGDQPLRLRQHPVVVAAAQRRVTTTLAFADLALGQGEHRQAVEQLRRLVGEEPLHEGLHARLMLALAGDGQQAAALELFARLRARLVEELGVEPGAELQEAQARVLQGDLPGVRPPDRQAAASAAGPPPAQLPRDISEFTGRGEHLEDLDALLPAREGGNDGDGGATAVVISAISGTAGVGKTALAVHWAHRVAGRFPDGQLYVNLRGFDPSSPPMWPVEVIRGFLHALGVSPHRIPTDPQAQAGLYRSLMAGKRMLVLLDNARDAAQVRPLLPGTAGCVVVVTSRDQLEGLVAHDGAHLLNVDVLTTEEASGLLEARLGTARVAAEEQAVEEIIQRCARLPLALVIVAARAVTHPAFALAALAGELRDAQGRLDALAGTDAVTDMRAVFTWSYRMLTPEAARLFQLLGLHPGPDTSAAAAASLAGISVPRVRPLLAELARIHLIVEHAPGRYTFHDLLRAYATELAITQESGDQRRAATRRLLDHYLHTTHAAAYQLNPHRDHPAIPIDPAPGVVPEELGGHGSALLAWLATEHAVLLAAVGLAVDSGLDTHAWQLAWALGGYLARSGRWQDWAATQRAALDAAERLGDQYELARAHRGLARAYRQLGRLDDAHTHLRHALRLSAELGDRVGLGYTHTALCQLFEMQEDLHAARNHAQRALCLFRSIGDVTGEALALNAAGWCHARLGDSEQALTFCTEALSLQQEIGDRYGEATTWDSLGYAHHHLGDFQQAIVCYKSSLVLRHGGGERYGEAGTLVRLGDTHFSLGDTQAAGEVWRRAAAIFDELDHPDADSARTRLQQVDAAGRRCLDSPG